MKWALSIWLALFACRSPGGGGAAVSPGAGDETVPGDTDTPDDTGSTPGPEALEVVATVSDTVRTLVTVTWSTDTHTTGVVHFGETQAYDFETPATEPGRSHSVRLLGMPADTEVHFEVEVRDGEAVGRTGDLTVTTGPLPPELPELTTTGDPGDFDDFLVTSVRGTYSAVVILDRLGRVVWYNVLDNAVEPMRSLLSADGEDFWVFTAGDTSVYGGPVLRISVDGTEHEGFAFPGIDHDMLERVPGTLAALVNVPDPSGETPSSATTVQELDEDGTSRLIRSAWDEFDPTMFDADLSENRAWTHGNALHYSEEHDAYYVSLAGLPALVCVDRPTGATRWVLFGAASDFTLSDGSETVERMHQLDVWDDRVLVFDNGSSDRAASRAAEFQLDTDTSTATQVWEYWHTDGLYVYVLGDVDRLDQGDSLVTWSTAGLIERVTPEGHVAWSVGTGLGEVFTYTQVVDSLYAR